MMAKAMMAMVAKPGDGMTEAWNLLNFVMPYSNLAPIKSK